MNRSASEAELSSEQESLEATQRVLGLDHGNVGEGSIQAAQAIEGRSISGVAVPPTEAGLGLESHSSQEQRTQENVEETSLQANTDQPTPTALPSLLNLEGISMDDIHDLLHPSVEERDILEEIVQIATGQVEASHQEPAVGINDGIVLQAPPSDMNNQRNGLVEASQQEDEEAGIVPRAPNVGLVVLEEPLGGEEDTGVRARTRSQQTQNSLPQQGTARRRILLQVPLGGAKGLSEPKHASEQEVELFPTEPSQHATNSCSGGTTAEESHAKEPLSAEGLISDHPDVVVQQTGRYVSGFSSASRVHLPLGFPGDACIWHASGELPYDMQEMSFGSEDGVNGQQSITQRLLITLLIRAASGASGMAVVWEPLAS